MPDRTSRACNFRRNIGKVFVIPLLLLTLVIPTAEASEAGADNLMERLLRKWETIESYRCVYQQFTFPPGKKEQSIRAAYLFAKPSLVRMEIVDGKGKGTVLLWQGGNEVWVRKKGLLSLFPLTLKRTSSLLLDPFGQDISQSTWQSLLDQGRKSLQEGRLEIGDGRGEDAFVMLLNFYSPHDGPFSLDRISIDREKLYPVRVERMDVNGQLLQEIQYQNIEINPQFEKTDFFEF